MKNTLANAHEQHKHGKTAAERDQAARTADALLAVAALMLPKKP